MAQMVKNLFANARDMGLVPGLGSSFGEGNGTPLQYSCLENPIDRGARQATVHGIAKSQTQLSKWHTHRVLDNWNYCGDHFEVYTYWISMLYIWNYICPLVSVGDYLQKLWQIPNIHECPNPIVSLKYLCFLLLWTPRANSMFIVRKKLHCSGSAQSKPVLFKG